MKNPSFNSYLQSKGQSIRTIAANEKHLNYYLNWCDDQKIESEYATYREVLSYVQTLQKQEIKSRTIQQYINSLKHYYSWLVATDQIEEHPILKLEIKGIKRRTLHHILSKLELESLYTQFVSSCQGLIHSRDTAMLGLILYQGITLTELEALTQKDLQLRKGIIHIPSSRRINERDLKLQPQQVMDLMEYEMQTRQALIELRGKPSEKLFISSGTSDRLNNTLQQLMQKLRALNNQVTSLKQIRASVITHWLKQHNLRQVQYMAGHKYVSSTEAFLINDLEDLKEDVLKFHPF